LSGHEVGKGAAYLYIEAITMMFSGYFFWFVMSKITTAAIIGNSSAVISLATIFTTIVTIGVPNGIQRLLGKSFFEQKIENTKVFIKTSLLIVSIGISVSGIIILIAKDWIYDVFKIDFGLLLVSILLIGTSAIYTLLRSIVVASLKTKVITIVSIISTFAKFALAIALVLVGTGVFGVTIGFTSFPILTSILLIAAIIIMVFKLPSNKSSEFSFRYSVKKIFVVSMAFWIPGVIATIGFQLGTIVVFNSKGADQAGLYFIALSIVTGISTVMSVLSTIGYPAISAMSDGRKRLIWRIIKITLITTLPLSSALIFYPKEVMRLFGTSYVEGASTLDVLLLSILPNAVVSGISVLAYSYGNNKQVLALGLAVSLPRTMLYFVLVPLYGGMGAAITYFLGSIMGFIVSIIVARKIKMQLYWKEMAFVLIIPTALAFILSYIGVNYIAGIIITLILSYALFLKMQILNRSDLQDALGILPQQIANPTNTILTSIAKKMNRFY